MLEYIEKIGTILWTPIMLVILIGSAVVLTFRFKFFQITQVKKIYKETVLSLFPNNKNNKNNKDNKYTDNKTKKNNIKSNKANKKDKKEITPFEAVSAALAGTMGVGNIAGVATAITAGGAGAIFWMWVSAFFCMIIKYIEVVLSQIYKRRDGAQYIGGPMYYISYGLKSRGIACLFSVFCIISSFGIGNMSQSNTISAAFESTFQIPKLITGLLVAAVTFVIIIGGVKRIVSFTSKCIPFMSVIYMLAALIVIVLHAYNLIPSLKLILTEAFSFKQAGAGILGFGIMRAVRYGISRGIFSNEAGLGSAPIAHAVASAESPVHQGMWGIFEVFFDTIVSCTLTALAILTTGVYKISGLDGIDLTNEAFSSVFGNTAGVFLAISIVFFAVATLISWSFYGECCVAYIFKNRQTKIINLYKYAYKFIFILLIVAGAVINIETVWSLSDICNVLMALPNIAAVIILSPIAYRETKNYLKSL